VLGWTGVNAALFRFICLYICFGFCLDLFAPSRSLWTCLYVGARAPDLSVRLSVNLQSHLCLGRSHACYPCESFSDQAPQFNSRAMAAKAAAFAPLYLSIQLACVRLSSSARLACSILHLSTCHARLLEELLPFMEHDFNDPHATRIAASHLKRKHSTSNTAAAAPPVRTSFLGLHLQVPTLDPSRRDGGRCTRRCGRGLAGSGCL
jgi:hypothetical protein